MTPRTPRTPVTVGVDVAKASLAIALWPQAIMDRSVEGSVEGSVEASVEGSTRPVGRASQTSPHYVGSVPNTAAGWEQIAAHVAQAADADADVRLVIEPTGGYELGLALWAFQRGWQVVRPNPARVREWAKSEGRRAKTDALDAVLLARYGVAKATDLHAWQPLPAEVSDLEQLLRQREDLEALQQRERTRLLQLDARPDGTLAVRGSIERLLQALAQEHQAVEEAIAQHLRAHPTLAAAQARLRSVPGIGARNVLPILGLLSRFQAQTAGQGTAKELVAFAGLDPQPFQSGTSVHRPAMISRMGEHRLRAKLYMGALGALRGENPVHTFYSRLVKQGKAKRLALVAASRKVLVWAWAVFTSGMPFSAAKTGQLSA